MEVISPAGSGPGPHTHEDSEEHFLILQGVRLFSVLMARRTSLRPAIWSMSRAGLHEFTVTTDATMMAPFTPTGDEQLLLDGSVLLRE